MKFRWKKTSFFALLGSIIIFIILFYGTFRSCDIKSAFGKQSSVIDAADLEKGLSSYQVDNGVWLALTDDAWIEYQLIHKGKLESIEIDIEFLNGIVAEDAQIYFSRGEKISGNEYVDVKLVTGNNVIPFDKNKLVQKLRFDLTSQKDIQFTINKIVLHYSMEKLILFWIFTPVLILGYCLFTVIYFNRALIMQRVQKNSTILHFYETVDQVVSLAVSDFRSRFSGSYLGMFWGIIQPLATILLFWFVFQVGFRSNPIDDVPFILWLAAGMIPWNYFYDSWFGGTNAFTSYSYIVKKVVFNVELLPIVKVLASAILNVIFNLILLCIYILYGEFPGYHIVDMIYFSVCIMLYALGWSYISATLNVFIKDIGQFLGIILQFLMWLTPMMWDYNMIPQKYSWFYKLNPLHYVINGYREALINGNWFYHHWVQMIWFWTVTLICLICGKKLMHKLKVHFADVL